MSEPLLSIQDLRVDYITRRGPLRAIDGLSLDIAPGEILGLAGESGSGKSTLAMALLRILAPPAVISGGRIQFEGRDILAMSEADLQAIRWRRIAMVFQGAMDALNPVTPVGEQIVDTLQAHTEVTASAARDRAAELLDMVSLDPGHLDFYAHQLSGGMRQRVGIALALALNPSLLILDEPTTALDVVVERDILARIKELQVQHGFAVLFITHDLARMLQVSDRIAILYAGRLAEEGPAAVLGTQPAHPYTEGLLRAFPSLHEPCREEVRSIPGNPPSLENPPSGCRFHPRCARVLDACGQRPHRLVELTPEHRVDCIHAE